MMATVGVPDESILMSADHHTRTCVGHTRYATAEAAWLAYLAKLIANETDPGQQVFTCRQCGWFHHGGAGFRSLGRLLAEHGWRDDAPR